MLGVRLGGRDMAEEVNHRDAEAQRRNSFFNNQELFSLSLCVSVVKIWTGGGPRVGQEGPQVVHKMGQLGQNMDRKTGGERGLGND